jgi:hypothetical protein
VTDSGDETDTSKVAVGFERPPPPPPGPPPLGSQGSALAFSSTPFSGNIVNTNPNTSNVTSSSSTFQGPGSSIHVSSSHMPGFGGGGKSISSKSARNSAVGGTHFSNSTFSNSTFSNSTFSSRKAVSGIMHKSSNSGRSSYSSSRPLNAWEMQAQAILSPSAASLHSPNSPEDGNGLYFKISRERNDSKYCIEVIVK